MTYRMFSWKSLAENVHQKLVLCPFIFHWITKATNASKKPFRSLAIFKELLKIHKKISPQFFLSTLSPFIDFTKKYEMGLNLVTIQKFECLENEKSFLDEIKTYYVSYFSYIIYGSYNSPLFDVSYISHKWGCLSFYQTIKWFKMLIIQRIILKNSKNIGLYISTSTFWLYCEFLS